MGRGGALSANKQVTSYPNDILKKAAEALVNAKTFRFDGGDNMPQAMNDAFFKAIVDVRPGPVQAGLDPDQPRQRPGELLHPVSPRSPAGRARPVLPAAHRHSEA